MPLLSCRVKHVPDTEAVELSTLNEAGANSRSSTAFGAAARPKTVQGHTQDWRSLGMVTVPTSLGIGGTSGFCN